MNQLRSSYELNDLIKRYNYDKKNFNLRVHGSGVYFDKIDLRESSGYMDFGPGFYLTDDFYHAEKRAIDKAMGKGRRKGTGEGYVYLYLIPKVIPNVCTFHRFNGPNISWVDFIIENRDNEGLVHNFDFVTGPTADAFMTTVIQSYKDGDFGEVGSDSAKLRLAKELKTDKLGIQTCITSNRGLSLIKRLDCIRVY